MIPDNSTNFLYLSGVLPIKLPQFYKRFEKLLQELKIDFDLLPNTKDIWAVDFMPIQINKNRFIQFKYKPDYLNIYPEDIPVVDKIYNSIKRNQWSLLKSDLLVDGGNISKTNDTVIMCDKVFHENKKISEKELIKQLKNLFEVDKIFFVPWNKYDFTGHVDGMVRFIDNKTVLINDYSKENAKYQRAFRMSLHNAGLDWLELPYNPADDSTLTSAKGLYLNYLQMEQAIVVPTFKSTFDEKAIRILEDIFKRETIVPIESNDVAKRGGILNCISRNIFNNT